MTKQEALKMVRDAQSHIETFGRCHAKAEKAASNDDFENWIEREEEL